MRIISTWSASVRWALIVELIRSARCLGEQRPTWYLTDLMSGPPNSLRAVGHR